MDKQFPDQLINELEYFSKKRSYKLFAPASEESILNAERTLGCSFSPQMRVFFKEHSGGRIIAVHIQGVQSIGLQKIPKDSDIVQSNQALRTFSGWNPSWLHLGCDLYGCYYVADMSQTNETGEYPIYWLDHEQVDQGLLIKYASGYSEFLLNVVEELKHQYTPALEPKE